MKVILPGSYDPVTVGHLDVIRRAAKEYDEVFAVVFINPQKTYRFSVEERVRMLEIATEELANVRVGSSDGFVIDYMKKEGIDLIVKGYRNDADLEYERVQAEWNKAHGGYETRLLKCSPELAEVSSTKVRAALDESLDPRQLLPYGVAEFIKTIGK